MYAPQLPGDASEFCRGQSGKATEPCGQMGLA